MKPARDPRIVFFDLETGGRNSSVHPVIQFGGVAVAMPEWEVVEELEVKIQFDPAICDPEALEVNSYDPETWKREAIPRWKAVTKIANFLRTHARTPIEKAKKPGEYWMACQLAGHNAATFDRPFLQALFEQEGRFCIGTFQVLDTLHLAFWGSWAHGQKTEDHKLVTLCEHYGIDLRDEAHDALFDARADVLLAKAMTEDLFQ